MNRSLERHLSRTLVLSIVSMGLAAGAIAFAFAYFEAEEFQDDTLRQIAALENVVPDASAPAGSTVLEDPESRVSVLRLPHDPRPQWLPADIGPGLHTLDGTDVRLRVYVKKMTDGARIVVAQSTEARDEIAIYSALRTLVPILFLLPLLVLLSVRIVRRELAPVRQLAALLDEQAAERPQPLPDDGIPAEISPFVRAINRLLERVNRMIAEQRRFVADAAHELRTPLTALSLQAQNMDKAPSLESMRERLKALRAGIDRARRLTVQLLSLARSQAESPTMEPVDVSKIARELIGEFLQLAEARNIDLGLDDAGNIIVPAESRALRLVLGNAIENALQCTPSGGEVTLRLRIEDSDAVVEICDSGPGIPAPDRERVFSPFYRGQEATHPGSGLGLSIARDAAARIGGTISLHDRPDGSGLLFRYRQRCLS